MNTFLPLIAKRCPGENHIAAMWFAEFPGWNGANDIRAIARSTVKTFCRLKNELDGVPGKA
jgi:hypothetical protein